jgi:acetoin utilization deacetylase AcuC-like enzyme
MSEPLLVVSHSACLNHAPGTGHPESPERLRAVLAAVEEFAAGHPVVRAEAPCASREALLRVHTAGYLEWLDRQFPAQGVVWLDPDTALSAGSREAVYRAAGAVEFAVGEVLSGRHRRAFCAVRPPGHHAEPARAMGFCFLDNVAVGAAAALAGGLERVAVVDFDVHHGNGTEAAFAGDERVLLCSLFQHPLYPGSGLTPPANGVFVPLPPGTDGAAYRRAFGERVEPALEAFAPQLILVSAGFDGHAGDPLAAFRLEDADYAWLTGRIVHFAREGAGVVSVLEGGYALDALRRAALAHLTALSGIAPAASEASASG